MFVKVQRNYNEQLSRAGYPEKPEALPTHAEKLGGRKVKGRGREVVIRKGL